MLIIGSIGAQIVISNVDWQSWFSATDEYDEVLKTCEAEACVVTAPPRWFFMVHENGSIEKVTLIEVVPEYPEEFPVLRENYTAAITPRL